MCRQRGRSASPVDGGIAAAYLIPAPVWFIVLDLGLAYLPMAWLGGRIIIGRTA